MLNLQMKNDIYFTSFETHRDLKHKILQLVMNQKANKIIYKGEPREIKYKLLKKIIPIETDNSDIRKFVKLDETISIRDNFNNFIDNIGNKPCLIYKKQKLIYK